MTDPSQEAPRITVERFAGGGEGVGHLPDGRVVFVRSAVPGDEVVLRLTEEKKRHARGEIVELVRPGADRTTPPCPHVAEGCGGCGWQHVDDEVQRRAKANLVTEALARLGGIEAEVDPGVRLHPVGGRTTARLAVVDGRAGYRRPSSRSAVAVDSCLILHPRADEIVQEGRFHGVDEVTVRVGAATGERLVLCAPAATPGVEVPDDVRVVGLDELRAGRRAWIHEVVAGHRFRVSARSFFQARPDAAAEMIRLARATVEIAPEGPLVDLYGGVGLFAATVADQRSVILVENDRSSIADARVNLARDATVVRTKVESWRSSRAAVVVADPPRRGLGAKGVEVVAGTGASSLVLVSCDAASLGRDAGLLRGAGFRLHSARLVDQFPHTPHVEVVATFGRGA